ncbi:DUF389 domain-containing protein [Leeia sp.]|uniref:DUF389 domain-containing protein n=1 Tax=Leeia sp. TaxID=2884678 RepID=UPI0035B468CD
MKSTLWRLLDLRQDQDDAASIDEAIRRGVQLRGTNLWVLMFAILIASIGLNVNSTAVIIGAMLISPLMGPIVGVGYGAGVNDVALIRAALRSFGVFVAISLLTATLYFLCTPLSQAQSELLARTTPTVWDVLIAFCGGAAGIVALTRKDISNAVPGVAIATALMPPLCTAGFGLATGNLGYFAGAFYLFSINCVFIAFATLLFVKLLKLPMRAPLNESARRRSRLLIGVAVVATMLPGVVLTYRLIQQEVFTATVGRQLQRLEQDSRFILLAKTISATDRTVTLTVGGKALPARLDDEVRRQLLAAGVGEVKVVIRNSSAASLDTASLKQELRQDLYRNTLLQLEERNATIARLQAERNQLQARGLQRQALIRELLAQYPEAQKVTVAFGEQAIAHGTPLPPVLMVFMQTPSVLPAADQQRLKSGLQVRFPDLDIELVVQAGSNGVSR